ncbi:L,D-transpeptidase family protein [Sphingomonas rubra]|uniref:Lipoprotein-anchoring transpeptidase ErfK/SrfK n=1 Tax=Sphingomonas rubra TaxID=634430 RepID=A0A1I5S075_9SPHN|nr:L,D-transpeptidase [Sphingomonas rubra]SFP63941.1 Lipoprotein-anchoring transpeptidase ErfK/SrfK [Sphingomonas rubra]
MKRLSTILLLAASAVASAQSAPGPAPRPTIPPVDRNILHVQVILDKLGFGPGVLDGRGGQTLTNALLGFQESRGLPRTGEPDAATLRALYPYRAARPTIQVTLDGAAFRGPFINPLPTEYVDQAKLDTMAYTRPLEGLAERFHTTPQALIALNRPGMRIAPGVKIVVPNALPTSRAYPADATPTWRTTLASLNVDAAVPQAERIEVLKSRGILRVLGSDGRLLSQYTATIGSARDPLPLGNWKVLHVSPNPDWKMNPAILKGVSDDTPSQIIPPGPNNPVGVVWIDLSKEHYGIHGTPDPAKIGVAQSNGCVRLTNWDAARIALMVKGGTPVIFRA